MKAILDTNVLVSALLNPDSTSAEVLQHWKDRRFELVTCEEQLAEFRRVTRYAKVKRNILTVRAGEMVVRLRKVATIIDKLPHVSRSIDPGDDYLLALAEAGKADFIVTGDKADLLALANHRKTKIVTLRQFAELLKI